MLTHTREETPHDPAARGTLAGEDVGPVDHWVRVPARGSSCGRSRVGCLRRSVARPAGSDFCIQLLPTDKIQPSMGTGSRIRDGPLVVSH
jgi:hypothetical protein